MILVLLCWYLLIENEKYALRLSFVLNSSISPPAALPENIHSHIFLNLHATASDFH